LILFQNCSINEARTGAAGGIGAKYLARKDSRIAAVLGSQAHAVMQLEAAHAVRPLTVATVFSPTESHRRACAEKIELQVGIEARAVSSAAEAIEEADIIITATDSRTPVFDGNLLKPGVHITSMSNGDKTRTRQEIDDTTMRRANPIFITSKETVCVNESDVFRAVCDKTISWDCVHEIADLLLDRVPGRTDDRQITLYKLQGTGIMDVAIGALAYERLKGSNLTQTL
jgi:alanine dehydrogenase